MKLGLLTRASRTTPTPERTMPPSHLTARSRDRPASAGARLSEAIPQRTPRRGRSRAAPRCRRLPEARRRPYAAATSRQSFAALRPLLCSWPSLPSGFAFPQRAVELAKGGTRAALRRRRSAGQRPAAARSARLGAGRRIPRRAAGGSLGRHSHAAFFPQGSSPARGQQRALAGALSAIREQAPLAHDPPFNRTQVKLGRWHGRGEAVGVPQRCRGWLWASGLRRARVSSAITCLLCAAACLSGPCSSSPLSFSWPDAHRHSRVETQVCMCRVLF